MIIGVIAGVYSFFSRISVTPGAVLKPSDPFTTTFTVTNEGQLSIYNVVFSCGVRSIEMENHIEVNGSQFGTASYNVPEIRSYEKTTTVCRLPMETPPILTADIEITVTYQPILAFWHKTHTSRFITSRQPDGTYHWLPMALH